MLGGAAAQNIFFSSNVHPVDLNGNKDLEFMKNNVSPRSYPFSSRQIHGLPSDIIQSPLCTTPTASSSA